MIKAIVYRSNTGYTAKYAVMLSEKLNVPAYADDEAQKTLPKGTEIVYLGWLMAGFIQGLKKAKKRFFVKYVCAVGMATPTSAESERIANQNHIDINRFSLLQGGFQLDKLKGMYYFMMKSMAAGVGKKLDEKADKTEEEIKMLDMMKNGGDFVSEGSAEEVTVIIRGLAE